MTFGEKVQKLRTGRGLSQDQLAELLEVSRQSVSKWERDEAMPDTDKIIALSRIFGVTTDGLLTGEELPAPVEPERPHGERFRQVERGTVSDFLGEITHFLQRRGWVFGLFLTVVEVFQLVLSGIMAGTFKDVQTIADVLHNTLAIGMQYVIGLAAGVLIVVLGLIWRGKGEADHD